MTEGVDISGPDFKGFLILMSYGMYKSLEDATGTDQVNTDIACMIAKEFAVQTTLTGVAQAVVDNVVRIHHDAFMTFTNHRKELCEKRKDITLLVRNFNYPLPNARVVPSKGMWYPSSDISTEDSTIMSGFIRKSFFHNNTKCDNDLNLDADGKVKAYVDFSLFYKAMNAISESAQVELGLK